MLVDIKEAPPQMLELGSDKVLVRLWWGCFYIFTAIASYHILIGSNLYILLIMYAISLSGPTFLLLGRVTFSSAFVFLLSVYSGSAALIIKAALNQPLQQNLFSPFASSSYLFIGYVSMLLCAVTSKAVIGNRSSNIGRVIDSPWFSRRSFYFLFAAGVGVKFLHIIAAPDKINAQTFAEGGFGGFGTLAFIFTMACAIAMKRVASGEERIPYVVVMVILITALLLTVISNTKKELLDLVLLMSVSIYAFDLKIRLRTIFFASVIVATTILFVAPTIQIMRADFRSYSFSERLEQAWFTLADNNFDVQKIYEIESRVLSGFKLNYTSAGSYVFPSTANLDRFALILPIDQVTREMESESTLGVTPFLSEIAQRTLPSLLIEKDPEVGADLVAWNYGFRVDGNIARPVVGFVASSLAAWGTVGVLVLPWLLLLPALLFNDYFFGEIKGRAWGVFGAVYCMYFVEKEIDGIVSFIFRDAVIIYIFSIALSSILSFGARSRNLRPAP